MTNSQTDIFTIFNLVDEQSEAEAKAKAAREEAEQRKKKEQEDKHPIAKESAPQPKPAADKDEFNPNEETIIRYYGESHPITAYFTPEELVEGLLVTKKGQDPERVPLTGEMLRKRMEKDFPELVKNHTEIIFISKKNIVVPTMRAKKKGNCMETLPTGSVSSFPKIPFSILQRFIFISKRFGCSELEIHADIYFDLLEKEYFLDIPRQQVNRYWVEVVETPQELAERTIDTVKVLEIHSHHLMAPRPSRQDDASERVPGMHYAIVGHTNRFFPEVTLRQFVSDEAGYFSKDIGMLFESPYATDEHIPFENVEVVQ